MEKRYTDLHHLHNDMETAETLRAASRILDHVISTIGMVADYGRLSPKQRDMLPSYIKESGEGVTRLLSSTKYDPVKSIILTDNDKLLIHEGLMESGTMFKYFSDNLEEGKFEDAIKREDIPRELKIRKSFLEITKHKIEEHVGEVEKEIASYSSECFMFPEHKDNI